MSNDNDNRLFTDAARVLRAPRPPRVLRAPRRVKIAMMAAASLFAAAAASSPAHAGEFDAAAFPATVEAFVAPDIGHAAGAGEEQGKPIATWALIAAAAAALAGIVKLLGVKRVAAAVVQTTTMVAKNATKAAARAAKAVGSAMSSPLRMIMAFAGLALFALTGVGLYDIEWIGGMAVGLAMAGIGAAGVAGLGKRFKMATARLRPELRPEQGKQ